MRRCQTAVTMNRLGVQHCAPPVVPPPLEMTDAQRLSIVRSLHTAVYVVVSASALVLLFAGLTGRDGPWLWTAAGLIAAEVVVFAGSGMRCPLTALAVRYGAERGHVFDSFLTLGMSRLAFRFFGTALAIGLLLIAARQFGLID